MKCNRCKSTLPESMYSKKRNGHWMKSCNRCREVGKKNKEKNKERNTCEHNRQRSRCKECGGSSICEHNRQRCICKECGDPIKITLTNMIYHSRRTDRKYDRYDANNFIDYCFLEGLVEDHPICFYDDCAVTLQYMVRANDMCTIERLDNSIGHTKANCVFCCLSCNNKKKSDT